MRRSLDTAEMGSTPSQSRDERQFLKDVGNHGKFRRILCDLAMQSDLALFDGNVTGVTSCWFRLAQEHLDDARVALSSGRSRAVYSRAYYGAYNASKAVRYLVNGEVSLKGDDHRKASELPDDFPRVDHWSRVITELYEDRLRADYENWANTPAEHTHLPDECLRHADGFVAECRQYLLQKYGVSLK